MTGPDSPELAPHQKMEAAVAAELFRSLLLGVSLRDESAAQGLLPDDPLPYVIRPSTTFAADAPTEEVLMPFEPLKSKLLALARARDWDEGIGQKAIYALVAKRAIRIDRKGKPMLLVC